ncbi:MAG TPA: hypothetical protein VIW64_16135 [Pyrinomonadaceae bacterium]|jgi:hypothetical protein
MSEELVITEERSELIVAAPVEAEFVVSGAPSLELLEVIERGPEGPTNYDAEVLAWLHV